jgi:hypothetical protein
MTIAISMGSKFLLREESTETTGEDIKFRILC